MNVRRVAMALLPILVGIVVCPAVHASSANDRARALLESARHRIAIGTPEQRQFARGELEDARAIAPGDAEIALLLARLCLEAGQYRQGRTIALELLARDSANADAQALVGSTWRRDWLESDDESSRDRAILWFARSLRTAPGDLERWRALVPLLVDAGEIKDARDGATLALRAHPDDPEAQVLLASMAERTGELALADDLFARALPRLPADVRTLYENVDAMVPPWQADAWDGMAPDAKRTWAENLWRGADPDPVTAVNEARLEYWSRVTHARLLWGRLSDGGWDMRASIYLRYGAPESSLRNPLADFSGRTVANAVVWRYPALGMRVYMSTYGAQSGYRPPMGRAGTWVMPFADSLARRGELSPVNYGWAVFDRLPAGVRPLDVHCALSRSPSDAGSRVLAQVEVPGSPGDALAAEWVVLDSAFTEVARSAEIAMGPSACDPSQARAASFARDLGPGRYEVVVHVRDATDGFGVARRSVHVEPARSELAMSDVSIVCGRPDVSATAGSQLRLELETGLVPAVGERLNAYVEIHHLAPDARGTSHYDWACTVRSAARDSRAWIGRALLPRPEPVPVEVSGRESTQGSVRRQFLSVPVGSLPAGPYRLEVRVRDAASGEASSAIAEFVKPS